MNPKMNIIKNVSFGNFQNIMYIKYTSEIENGQHNAGKLINNCHNIQKSEDNALCNRQLHNEVANHQG
jgi:hypothetical protein